MAQTTYEKALLAPTVHHPIVYLLLDISTLYRRSLLRLFRVPAQLYFSLVQPLIWFILFGQMFSRLATGFGIAGAKSLISAQFGTGNYSAFFLPAIIIQVLLFGSSNSALGIITDEQSGYLNKLRVAPINRFAILIGTLLADLTRMMVQVLILVIVGLLFGVRFDNWALLPLILVIAALFSLMIGGFGLYIGLATRNTQTTFLAVNIVTFPLLFISPAQLPITLLPEWLQVAARFNPVTYAITSTRVIIIGVNAQQIADGQSVLSVVLLSIGILFVLACITLSAATYRFSKQVQ